MASPGILLLAGSSLAVVGAAEAAACDTLAWSAWDGSEPTLQFNSDAGIVTPAGAAPRLRLTPAQTGQHGSAFTSQRIDLAGDASFSSRFSFQLTGAGGAGGGADGFVFVVQTVNNTVGSTGGGIGYSGISNSLGIEFDTYYNGPGYADPDANHVGVDLDGAIRSVAVASVVEGDLKGGAVWHAWVDYDGVDERLEVRLAMDAVRPEDPLLSYEGDLADVLGRSDAYVGFTSGTGAGYANHDVLDWQLVGCFGPLGAPSAVDDAPTTDEDTPLAIDVLANDTGGGLEVTSVDTTGTVGDVTIGTDGTIGYDPSGEFDSLAVGDSDTDTFTYTVTDATGATDSATVTVTVDGVDDPPTVFLRDTATLDEGGTVGLGFSVEDDDGAPSVSVSLAPRPVSGVDPEATCTAEVAAQILVTCDDDGHVLVTVTATDGAGSDSKTADVSFHNVAPTVTVESPAGPAAATVGDPLPVVAAYTDPGANDTHTCTLDPGDGSGPVAGTVDAGAGTCTGAVTFGTAGTHTVTVAVTDDDGGSGDATLEVEVLTLQDELAAFGDDLLALGADDHHLDKAAKSLGKALDDKHWTEDGTPDPKHGDKVFKELAKVLKELGKADPSPELDALAGELWTWAEALVADAVGDTEGKAAGALDKARDKWADGDADKAFKELAKAWKHAFK